MSGPLSGVRIIEMGGIGPAPFAAMLLADHGAEVIRIDRPNTTFGILDAMLRSRKLVELDLKLADDIGTARELIRSADILIESFRPGTMERLGLGPDVLMADNPKLIYCRMTGWGQTGPYAPYAGQDINYISLSGALHAVGTAEKPIPPLILGGDLGGGGMFLAFSAMSALHHATMTGEGQVIDCAMTEGAGLLMTAFYELNARGQWHNRRAANHLDGGAHFYNAYETADGKFISLAPLEPQFYALFRAKVGLEDDPQYDEQWDQAKWPALIERLTKLFKTKSRDEWCTLLEKTDVCFAPVLSMAEAPHHEHAQARESFVVVNKITQPAPAPRFSATPLTKPSAPKKYRVADLLEKNKT